MYLVVGPGLVGVLQPPDLARCRFDTNDFENNSNDYKYWNACRRWTVTDACKSYAEDNLRFCCDACASGWWSDLKFKMRGSIDVQMINAQFKGDSIHAAFRAAEKRNEFTGSYQN